MADRKFNDRTCMQLHLDGIANQYWRKYGKFHHWFSEKGNRSQFSRSMSLGWWNRRKENIFPIVLNFHRSPVARLFDFDFSVVSGINDYQTLTNASCIMWCRNISYKCQILVVCERTYKITNYSHFCAKISLSYFSNDLMIIRRDNWLFLLSRQLSIYLRWFDMSILTKRQ